jgi:plasmid replication initiation protein
MTEDNPVVAEYTPPKNERAHLKPFVAASNDAAWRDQRDLMERPFFSLSKSHRTTPIQYKAQDVEVHVFGMEEHGMATIWDADVLIWAASQLVEADNRGQRTSRLFRFKPYQFLRGVERPTGMRQYELLKAAFGRLQSTVVATSIRNGKHWRRQQFSWISEWDEYSVAGQVEGVEFILPEWFYRGVLDHSLVLAFDPAYFRLTGGIERWLYRVARKHAGTQPRGWLFDIAHLHDKSGSLARLSDFALDLRRIAARQPLPGYQLKIERDESTEYLRILPQKLSTGTVDKPVDGLGTSGATTIGTSGAELSVHQAHGPQLSLWEIEPIRRLNLSNRESNLKSLRAKEVSRSAVRAVPRRCFPNKTGPERQG